jgi:hypothetical protein
MYCPNFKDKRVRKRAKIALGFALACIGDKPSRWAQVHLDKYFGPHQTQLSKFLRKTLLVVVDDHYSMDEGIPKEYIIRNSGVQFLRAALQSQSATTTTSSISRHESQATRPEQNLNNLTSSPLLSHSLVVTIPPSTSRVEETAAFDAILIDKWAEHAFGPELKSLAFEYEDKSSRLWHPLQSVRKNEKKRLLAAHGLKFSYDIQCAAPTLLLQYAQNLTENLERNIYPLDLYLPSYSLYLKNRKACRERLAQLLEVDDKFAKTVLNSLFCGAQVGAGPYFALFRLLGTYTRIEALKDDEFITSLRADIKQVWKYIEPTLTKITKVNKAGKTYKVRLSPKRKWNLYFSLERKVLDCVISYLKEKSNKHFLEHDGWATESKIDVQELQKVIFQKTGFRVVIEEEELK